MIAGIFHKGSGLGNQLHRYVATRVLALDKGYEFSMVAPELFKGKDFMNLDMGRAMGTHYGSQVPYVIEEGTGRVVHKFAYHDWIEWDKHCYDPDINFVEDNTIIDGNFEDERYFEHKMHLIREWLATDFMEIPDDVCVIGFRGGEYYTVPELGLPKEYYDRAILEMKKIVPNIKFEVHTDDIDLAKQFFPDFSIIRDIKLNWNTMRWARFAIIANSSFYVLPRLMRHDEHWNPITIAPRYWNRYNTKKWDYPQGYYKSFKYI